ncbi:hypothetical protein Tco_1075031 [Tanacetum coccineum]
MCLLNIPQRRASDLESKFVLVFVEAAKRQILGGDQLLVILCGFGTKSLEFGISFLSMTISGAASYAYSGSLLLTPSCCDDIHDVTPRVSALAGCDKPSEFITTTTTTPAAASKPSQDKGKAKMIESEKPLKKKDQIMYDQEVALNLQAQLQAELEEEERLTRQKEEEANIALIESWDNTQAMMDADYQMAQQLQAKEQKQLSIEEKSKLFVQLLEARKKHFAEMRAREKRNKPPTQAQQRKLYCNYLKNMEGYTLKQLKGFKFEVIKDMFDKAFKRVNTFFDYKTELFEGSKKRAEDSTKRAGIKLEQEVAKKKKIDNVKVDDDQEEARMKELMNIVPNEEEVAINAIPLATKPPCIVDWKIIKEGKIS